MTHNITLKEQPKVFCMIYREIPLNEWEYRPWQFLWAKPNLMYHFHNEVEIEPLPFNIGGNQGICDKSTQSS